MLGLEIKQVSVAIKEQKILDSLSFEVPSGKVMALVGHNGAGKSTLIKTILGLQEKSSGEIIVNEKYTPDADFLAFKQFLSYLPEEPLLLTELTVMQHFQLYGNSYRLTEKELNKRVTFYIEEFELTDKLNEYPEALSKGMRQKVQTICALLPDAAVLLIDEPFMGLDVYAIDFLEEELKQKAAKGTTILLTTHQLDRVKNIADEFVMLQAGRILDKGSIEDFHTIKRRTKQ